MKPLITLIVTVVLFLTINKVLAQHTVAYTDKLIIYRTADDFFNKKETVLGKIDRYIISDGDFSYFDQTNTKQKINLGDSNIYAFKEPEIHNNVQIYYIKTGARYYQPFCGGTKDYFVVSALKGYGTFDADGYVTGDFETYGNNTDYSYNYIEFWYNDKIKNITTKNIEEILANSPDIKEKYLAEKAGTDKKIFKKNKHYIAIKYFKQYAKANTK